MISNYHIISVSHQNVNIQDIGHFVIQDENDQGLDIVLNDIKHEFGWQELVYLSTCNRVCFVIYANDQISHSEVSQLFSKINPERFKSESNILDFVDIYSGEIAVKQLFKIASSIDSLVVGEREIFRQLRSAFEFSKTHKISNDHLRLLEDFTIKAAKDVFHQTKIGERPVSVVSLAIQRLLQHHIPKNANIAIVGAGETNHLVSKFLLKYQFNSFTIFNRSVDNAKALSHLLNAPSHHLNALNSTEDTFDVIIACTGATQAIVDSSLLSKLTSNSSKKHYVLDLGVPSDVEYNCDVHSNVVYLDIEQIRQFAKENLEFRKSEVASAISLLENHLVDYKLIVKQRALEKKMSSIPSEIRSIKTKAIESVYKKDIENLDEQSRQLVYDMLDYMEKKCIAVPMKYAKKLAEETKS